MYNADYIIQTVEKLRKKYRTKDPYELCSAMHIVLYRKDLQKKLDFSMLFISHDLDVVRAVSDRVIVIRHGVLIEEGPTEEVYERPRQEYTRSLLDAFYYDKDIPGSRGEEEETCF